MRLSTLTFYPNTGRSSTLPKRAQTAILKDSYYRPCVNKIMSENAPLFKRMQRLACVKNDLKLDIERDIKENLKFFKKCAKTMETADKKTAFCKAKAFNDSIRILESSLVDYRAFIHNRNSWAEKDCKRLISHVRREKCDTVQALLKANYTL